MKFKKLHDCATVILHSSQNKLNSTYIILVIFILSTKISSYKSLYSIFGYLITYSYTTFVQNIYFPAIIGKIFRFSHKLVHNENFNFQIYQILCET